MIIRPAVKSDLMGIAALGRAMIGECSRHFPALNEARVGAHLDLSIAMPGVFLVDVAEHDGELVGINTAVCTDYAFSYEKRAVGDVLFVLPGRRGSVAAGRFLSRFIDWAKESGARRAILGVTTGIAEDRTQRMFTRLGFEPMGAIYCRDIV